MDASGGDPRRVQFEEPEVEAKPGLGLDYVEYMLSRPHSRDSVLSLSVDQLTPLLTALTAWKVNAHTHTHTHAHILGSNVKRERTVNNVIMQ